MHSTINSTSAQQKSSTILFNQVYFSLYTSILPLYLWMEKFYLLTIKANHHHVYWNHIDFKKKTEDIGSKAQESQQSWTHSVITFPFKPKQNNDTDYKLKLGVHVFLPLSLSGKDIQNLET